MRLALIACLALGACASPALPPPQVTLSVECLPLKAYTQAEQDGLRAQLASLPQGSPVQLAMLDYLKMRDADRACMGVTK